MIDHISVSNVLAQGDVVELVEWRTAESEVSGSNPWQDSHFWNRNQFSITSGQRWMEPILSTVKWVKKVSCGGVIDSALNSHNCSVNYTKTKTGQDTYLLAQKPVLHQGRCETNSLPHWNSAVTDGGIILELIGIIWGFS